MNYIVDVFTLITILAIAAQGYSLIKGLGGLLHLGHAVFYGVGAYTAAILSIKVLPAGSFPVAVIAGAVAGALAAAAVGWPALRERGRYFMIVTFAIQLIFVTLVINLSMTGGPDGLSGIPKLGFGPWQATIRTKWDLGFTVLNYAQIKLLVMLGFLGFFFWFCRRIVRSPFGRLVRAVREDERVVEAYGRRAQSVKLAIFMIGAGVTGAAGALFAFHFNYVGPSQFELDLTMLMLVMLILGGQYSLVGASVGAALMILLLEALRFLLDNVLAVPFEMTAHLRQVVFSAALIIVLAFRSRGLFPERLPQHQRARAFAASAAMPVAVQTLLLGEPVLTARNVSKRFGGLQAVDGAGLDLNPGRITAIVGPNGAGKTSFFNILSGFETSDQGDVRLGGKAITSLAAEDISRLGLARTFQDVRVWNRLTVIENILASRAGQIGENPLLVFAAPSAVRQSEAENLAVAWGLLERFGLAEKANEPASQLSYAQRKMLALARIAAFAPQVMLLDEPTSGVDPKKLDVFLAHIRAFAREDGRAVALIEHNMTVVRDLADWVIFMDEGRVVRQGPPLEVLGDAQLMRLYLGRKERQAA